MTNTKAQKWGIVAIVLVALAASFGVVKAVQAQSVPLSITAEVKKAVTCFSLARSQGLGTEVTGVYLNRVGKAKGTYGAVYQLGYIEGSLDAYGFANSSKFGNSMGLARIDAAKNLYKLLGCTINEKI